MSNFVYKQNAVTYKYENKFTLRGGIENGIF